MKKLINDPNAVAAETVEGLALAYPHILKKLVGIQAVARNDAPVRGKVAVLTGGGSGHEPLFAGYVGRGLPDASVAGNIFASPPPIPIMSAAKQVHSGRGVLLLYGNYSGDILNFDVAAEELMADGIEVVTVRISDDVASAPRERRQERRGFAGRRRRYRKGERAHQQHGRGLDLLHHSRFRQADFPDRGRRDGVGDGTPWRARCGTRPASTRQ